MSSQMFVNMAVRNLDRSVQFFKGLGFTFNPQFTDKNAACMVVGNDCYVMLLTREFFQQFTGKEICDATRETEMIVSVTVNSRDKVHDIVDQALRTGATTYKEPMDEGWMFQRAFADPDGHQWEFVYMDVENMPKEMLNKM